MKLYLLKKIYGKYFKDKFTQNVQNNVSKLKFEIYKISNQYVTPCSPIRYLMRALVTTL